MDLAVANTIVTMVTVVVGAVGLYLQRRADATKSAAEADRIRADIGAVTRAVIPADGPSLSQWMRSVDRALDGIRDDTRADRQALDQLRAEATAEHRLLHRRISNLDTDRKPK